jgi:hypothetical protein
VQREILRSKVEAWMPTVKGFLGTLRDITLQYTPPKTANEHIASGMEEFGIEVRILNSKGEVLKHYMIGGVTPGENGTYAKLVGSDQPFVVHKKFSEGGLRKQFDRSVEEWRNRFIFQEEWDEISKVSVDYPKFPSRSFVIQKENEDAYAVTRPGEPLGSSKLKLRRGEAEAYLMHFEEVGIESFENNHKQRDSILQIDPFVSLTLLKEDGERKWLKLYPLNHVTGEIDLSEGYVNSGQLFRFLGDYSSGDFIMIQHFTIGETLRKYDDFKK